MSVSKPVRRLIFFCIFIKKQKILRESGGRCDGGDPDPGTCDLVGVDETDEIYVI